MGVGSAVVSTPYWHAAELLADGRGRLFNFDDSDGLSTILMELLDNPEALKNLRIKAYEYGKTIIWPKTGEKYIAVATKILEDNPKVSVKKRSFSIRLFCLHFHLLILSG